MISKLMDCLNVIKISHPAIFILQETGRRIVDLTILYIIIDIYRLKSPESWRNSPDHSIAQKRK